VEWSVVIVRVPVTRSPVSGEVMVMVARPLLTWRRTTAAVLTLPASS
jgi:hypothetical protein